MDKRVIANERVKRNIANALFELMEKKSFSDITVTDIVTTANVARASYYRNFDTRESIIEEYLEQIHQEAINTVSGDKEEFNYFDSDNYSATLVFYLEHKKNILLLYDAGFGTLILDEINTFAEEILGDMPIHSIQRFSVYMIAGAMYNVMIQWLKSGANESVDQMAELFKDFLSKVSNKVE